MTLVGGQVDFDKGSLPFCSSLMPDIVCNIQMQTWKFQKCGRYTNGPCRYFYDIGNVYANEELLVVDAKWSFYGFIHYDSTSLGL